MTALVACFINGFVVETKKFDSAMEAQSYVLRARQLQDKVLSESRNAILGDASFEMLLLNRDNIGAHNTYDLIPREVLESDNFRALIALMMGITDRDDDDDLGVEWLRFNSTYFDEMAQGKRVTSVIDALIKQSVFARELNLILQSQVFKKAGIIQSINCFVQINLRDAKKD